MQRSVRQRLGVSTHPGMTGHLCPRRRCLGLESPVSRRSTCHGRAEVEAEDLWPSLETKRRGPACAATMEHLIVAGGVSGWHEVLDSVEVFHIESKALRRGGHLRQPRAFFKVIPVGTKHPRMLAVGGQNETSILGTTEWWEEEDNDWEEGPSLSTERSSFAAILAQSDLVCSGETPPLHSCPLVENNQTCLFPNKPSGALMMLSPQIQLPCYL